MKILSQDSYTVRPFTVHKTHQYEFNFNQTENERISVMEAISPPLNWIWSGSNEEINNNGIYKKPLFSSLNQLLYHNSHSIWYNEYNRDLGFNIENISSVYVVSINQAVLGLGIRPTSFRIGTGASTGSYSDDGYGRIVNENSDVIGNIFYTSGLVVLKKSQNITSLTGSVVLNDGLYLENGSNIEVIYDSTKTIYEHRVICTLERGEFNYSTNPSIALNVSSSISGSNKIMDQFASGTLAPYITTIGLYNNKMELVAIGKVATPVKRIPDIEQSFIIRFDI